MPRPKHSDPAKTFAAIVDAAVVVLQEQGPNHVSLRRVSEASGLSMGTLTYYFPNRQDLVEACLDVHYQHISAGILEFHAAVTEGPVDAALIRHHVGRLVDIAFADRSFLQLRALVMAEAQQYHPGRLNEHLLPTLDLAVKSLAEAVGVEPLEVRLAALTYNYAVARYAVLTDEELTAFTGIDTVEAARARVREHIAEGVCRALRLA